MPRSADGFITSSVTSGVVDLLESVEVDHHERDRVSGALRAGEFALGSDHEGTAIWQAGECIEIRQIRLTSQCGLQVQQQSGDAQEERGPYQGPHQGPPTPLAGSAAAAPGTRTPLRRRSETP